MDHTVRLYPLERAFSTSNLKVSISLFNLEMSDQLYRQNHHVVMKGSLFSTGYLLRF